MKKILQSVLLCSVVLALSFVPGRSQSILVHYWNFNSFATTTIDSTTAVLPADRLVPIPADYTRVTARTASILYTKDSGVSATYFTYLDGNAATAGSPDYDTINLRMGDTAGMSLRPRNPSDSMQLLFYIPTTHYKNIVLTYATESSSAGSGPQNQIYDYSVDSGATWKTSGLSMASTSAAVKVFSRASVSLAGDTTTNNNSKLIFRIKLSGQTSGSSGNNRFDNVTVDADTMIVATDTTVDSSSSVSTVTAGNNATYTLYPNPVTDHISILSSSESAKMVRIYNTEGQTVYMALQTGKLVSVSTAALSAGIYYIAVRDNNSGNMQAMKFVKE